VVVRQLSSRLLVVVALVILAACHQGRPLPEGDSMPAPRRVSTEPYHVGAYYFPGWYDHSRWQVLDEYPERVPLLGYYREGDPSVMDWQIKWALEHGISFFVFDWYWDRGSRQLEHALHEGYLRSRFRPFMKFCLLWANHNPPRSHTEEDLMAVLDYWIDQYFWRPEYFTIDGRPVVIIFSSPGLSRDLGSEGVKRAFAKMRERARARGLPGVFLVAVTGPGEVAFRERLQMQKDEGYDATTGYNYPRAGMDPTAFRADYESAIYGYSAIWNFVPETGIIDYFPVTDPGWDSRPWHGQKALVRTERTPRKFERMLANARVYVDRHPLKDGRRIVLIEAWNEYGEGAAIEPHCEWGFGYLEATRKVFAAPGRWPSPLTPQELGFVVPQVDCPPGAACPDPRDPCRGRRR
jgi:Glycosyltransferase WbsX